MGLRVVTLYTVCEIANLHIKHIPNNTFKLLTPTIRSIHVQTISDKMKQNSAMPGQFVQSY